MGEAGLHPQLVGLQGCVTPTMAAKEATFGGWRRVAIPPSSQVPAHRTPSFLLEVSDQGGTWGHMPARASPQGHLPPEGRVRAQTRVDTPGTSVKVPSRGALSTS